MKKLFSILLVACCIGILTPSVASVYTVKSHESGHYSVDNKVSKTQVAKATIVELKAGLERDTASYRALTLNMVAPEVFLRPATMASKTISYRKVHRRPVKSLQNVSHLYKHPKTNIFILNCNIRQCYQA